MRTGLDVAACSALCAALLVAACAVAPPAPITSQAEASVWRGRLAVRVEADPPKMQSQALAAGFELSGNAQAGELTLFTPLGTTAAALSWTSNAAIMRSNGDVRHFDSLTALIRSAVGTEVPVAALFAWFHGENMTAAGWNADLTQYASGRITARRLQPAPVAELTLLLEK